MGSERRWKNLSSLHRKRRVVHVLASSIHGRIRNKERRVDRSLRSIQRAEGKSLGARPARATIQQVARLQILPLDGGQDRRTLQTRSRLDSSPRTTSLHNN